MKLTKINNQQVLGRQLVIQLTNLTNHRVPGRQLVFHFANLSLRTGRSGARVDGAGYSANTALLPASLARFFTSSDGGMGNTHVIIIDHYH